MFRNPPARNLFYTFDPIVSERKASRARDPAWNSGLRYVLAQLKYHPGCILAVGLLCNAYATSRGFFSGTFTFGALFSLSVGLLYYLFH